MDFIPIFEYRLPNIGSARLKPLLPSLPFLLTAGAFISPLILNRYIASSYLPADARRDCTGLLLTVLDLAKYKENCKMISYNCRSKQYKTIGAEQRI